MLVVFKRFLFQVRQKSGLCGKELKADICLFGVNMNLGLHLFLERFTVMYYHLNTVLIIERNNERFHNYCFKVSSDKEILALFKLKAFLFDRLENTVGKGENAECQGFLLFPKCFQKALFPGYAVTG